ncbi:hypothetical protein Tco_0553543 [Tanacetum coccineum]
MKTGMRPVNAAKPKDAYNDVKRNRFNAIKASTCWVWMPKIRVVDHVSKNISASVTLKRLDYIDAQGRLSLYGCTNSGEARVQQRKRRIQRRVQQKQKDQEDEVFGRILSEDKSDQAEEGPNNFALMAYSSTSSNSEVSTDSNYSSPCLENVKILKEQNEQLLKDLRTSKLNAIAYKIGLESVEARLLVYKKNEYVFEEDIKVLKCEIHLREVAITELKRKLELAQKQKDKFRKFMPPKPDLSFSGLEEFTSKPIVIKPIVKNSEDKASEAKPKVVRKNNGAPIIKDWVSDNEEDDVL